MRANASLGLWTLAALVVANMIGAGVFTTSGFALADLGSPYRVMLAWGIGGAVALCGAMSYGGLARLIPESGGEYLFLSRAFHPAAGFVAGWISFLAGFTASIAFSALTFSAYTVPAQDAPFVRRLTATAVIVIAVLLHALRMRIGTGTQNAAVAIKLAVIVGVCAFALYDPGLASWEGLSEVRAGAYDAPAFSIASFALTLMWISFSYLGFNAAVYIAEEVPGAALKIPRALVLGTALTMLVYLMLNTVFVLLPPFDAAAGQEDIAAVAAAAIGTDALALVVRALVALALFTSVSAMVMIGPRVYAKMADEGYLPESLRFRGETPRLAVLAQGGLAIAVVWAAGLRELLSYLGFTLGLSTAAAVAGLFVVARRDPARARDLPGYPWAPAVFVTATLVFAALAASVNPWEMLAALVTIVSGGLLYLGLRGRRRDMK